MSLLKLINVSKFYHNKKNVSTGFNKVNLSLDQGEFVVITGESGSGKSTLLNVISGLDSYEEGELYINGEETSHYTEKDYEDYRRKYIGNIFQNFNLVNSYTVYQNIELVLLLNGEKKRNIKKKVLEVIDLVKLTKFKNTKASKLSGGQKQRVAIARALVKNTPIIVADEPTGNIDIASAKEITKLLYEISKNKLVVVVTHNYEQFSEYATRQIIMHDGRIMLDKKLKETEEVIDEPPKYKNITLLNKLRIAFRNVFNIKIKFFLLILVYFILTISVFSNYTSLNMATYNNQMFKTSYVFNDSSEKRIIINKKDKSPFSEEEIEEMKKISNVKEVVKDDILIDSISILECASAKIWDSVITNNIANVKKVKYGRLPNEEDTSNVAIIKIIGTVSKNEAEKYLNNTFSYTTNNGEVVTRDLKIIGIIEEKDNAELIYNNTLYVSNDILSSARTDINLFYSDIEVTLNNKIYSSNDSSLYFNIKPHDAVSPGNAIVSEDFNMYCKDYNCLKKNIGINIKNNYYATGKELYIIDNFKEKTINKKLGFTKEQYYEYNNTIFMNPDEYKQLFNENTYQMSIYVNDERKIDNVTKELDKYNVNIYKMVDMTSNIFGSILGFVTLFGKIRFIVSIIVLFFICYFIIKIILKSRNTYFSTIRTLGGNKKVLNDLLNIELLVDINIAYILFTTILILIRHKIILKISYLYQLSTFFELKDYIIIYIVLIVMSILIANRYSKKLFGGSVMSNYRENE
ncbi:MAG: ABC transporter ATP-binding protein [Bacilli bacterium]|nr:ABC transporter ATP-binding protein [Bacilli bacterium]